MDIRDKKYEIFRRWNEAYYQALYPSYSLDITTHLQYYKYLEEMTKELEFIFSENKEFHISVRNIAIQSGKLFDIKVEINRFELKSKTHELDDEQKIYYQSQLAPVMLQMNRDRNILQKIFYEEFKL